MHWLTPWIGLEYEELGRGPKYDCWGLWLALTRLRTGVEVPDPQVSLKQAVRSRAFAKMMPLFEKVQSPCEGDVLLFISVGRPIHIGYALDGMDMIHINETHGSLIERWNSPFWKGKLEGIYRRV